MFITNLFKPKKFNYQDYLRSRTWDRIRRAALKRDRYHCQLNAKHTGPLHVHHNNYDRVGGKELASDLITLCENCHKMVHGK